MTNVRAWRLFSLLPFWLLRKTSSQGQVGKSELCDRVELFVRRSLGCDQGRVLEQSLLSVLVSGVLQAPGHQTPEQRGVGGSVTSTTVLDGGMFGTQFDVPRVARQRRELPPVFEIETETPVEMDRCAFIDSLRSSLGGVHETNT